MIFPDLQPSCVVNPPCPWLPEIHESQDFTVTRRHGADRGEGFYLDALRYAQSHWIAGKPAQAVLQLNKAWMADLTGQEPALSAHPPPYRALGWILVASAGGTCGYLGNPVRHFQHLATRVTGPHREIRSWRAWLCYHLAEMILDPGVFRRDGDQLARDGIWVPRLPRALAEISTHGWPGEMECAESAAAVHRWQGAEHGLARRGRGDDADEHDRCSSQAR